MNKNIKDYLHLYLGCEVKSSEGTEKYILTGVTMDGGALFRTKERWSIDLGHGFKPILRPLSDMSEEEGKSKFGNDRYWDIVTGEFDGKFSPEETLWLLSEHFDIFNLIEAGIAIDKTTLNQQ